MKAKGAGMTNPVDQLIQSRVPIYMGILNLTPDSFSDGLPDAQTEDFLTKAEGLMAEGAHILDLGGESTRPNADPVSVEHEMDRVLPFLRAFRKKYPDFPISVDTKKYQVAKAACAHNIQVINDVSFLSDPRMVELCTENQCYYVLMHSRGDSQTMMGLTDYDDALISNIFKECDLKIQEYAKLNGVLERLVFDLGFGFAKTPNQCVELMEKIAFWQKISTPKLLGVSRKRFLQKYVGENHPQDRDLISAQLALKAYNAGFSIIRTHNVALTKKVFSDKDTER